MKIVIVEFEKNGVAGAVKTWERQVWNMLAGGFTVLTVTESTL